MIREELALSKPREQTWLYGAVVHKTESLNWLRDRPRSPKHEHQEDDDCSKSKRCHAKHDCSNTVNQKAK
jgi:hypothetical protein